MALYERYVAHDLLETSAEPAPSTRQQPPDGFRSDRHEDNQRGDEGVFTASYRRRRLSLEDSIATNPDGVRIYLGGPGSGKSALLRYIALDLLSESPRLARVSQVWGRRVPVWIPFGAWVSRIERGDRNAPITSVVREWLTQWEEGDLFHLIEQALEDKKILLLVDGLDEWTSPDAARLAIAQLRAFAARQSVPIVLTSRPHGFKMLSDELPGWRTEELAPLSRAQQLAIAERWFENRHRIDGPEAANVRSSRRQAQDAIAELQRVTDIATLAEVPLLLSILLMLRTQNVELPSNRFRAYAELTRHLMILQPRRRALSAQQTGRLPPLDEKELESCYAYLAFRVHKESPTGVVPIATGRMYLDEALRSESFGIGFSVDEASRISRELITVGESVSGLLVKRSPTDLGFYHRVIQENLAAIHLSSCSEVDQIETIAAYATDPQWREVILALVVRSASREMVAKFLRAIETSPASSPAVEQHRMEVLAEIAAGPAQCPLSNRRALLEAACTTVEEHWSTSHRQSLTRALLSGLRRPAVKTSVLPRLRRWFPARVRFRAHLIRAAAAWPEDELWPVLQRILINDEDEASQLAAAEVMGNKWGSDNRKQDALCALARLPHTPMARAASLVALLNSQSSVDKIFAVLAAEGTRLSPELRFVQILARLKTEVRLDTDRSDLLSLLSLREGVHYTWRPLITNALQRHWPRDHFIRDACIKTVQDGGAYGVPMLDTDYAWQILLDGYPQDDVVAGVLCEELNQKHPRFARIDWFFLGRQFRGHSALAARLETWIAEHRETTFVSEVAGAATVGCTAESKAFLLSTLGKSSHCFWSAEALLLGWGLSDADVAAGLGALAHGSNREAANIAYLIPDIITNHDECQKRLYELLGDPAVDRLDFVIRGLSRLGGLRHNEYFIQLALRRLPESEKHIRDALTTALIISNPDAPRVRDLALGVLKSDDLNGLSAVIEAFSEDPNMRERAIELLTPLATDFRIVIAEHFLRSRTFDDDILNVCRSFNQEYDCEIATMTSVALFQSLQAISAITPSDMKLLRDELRSYGLAYESRRQAAYASALELGRYELIDENSETIGDPLPLRISLAHYGESNSILVRQVLLNWTKLAERYPAAVLCRFQTDRQIANDLALPQSVWATLATEMDGRTDADKVLQQSFASWDNELLEPALLRYLARTEPGSLRLRVHCVRVLTTRERPWQLEDLVETATDILAHQYRGDQELWKQVETYIGEVPFRSAAFIALARAHPDNEVLYSRSKEVIGDSHGVPLLPMFMAICIAGTVQQLINCIDRYWGHADPVGRWLFQPLVDRLSRDKSTRLELETHTLQRDSNSACVAISVALSAAAPLDTHLRARLRRLLDNELASDAIAAFTFDSRSGAVRSLAAVLTDLFKS